MTPDPLKPVNLGGGLPYNPEFTQSQSFIPSQLNEGDTSIDALMQYANSTAKAPNDLPLVPGGQLDTSGRFTKQFVGQDNEDMYGNHQGAWSKVGNDLMKLGGVTAQTLVNGTAGLVNGIFDATIGGKGFQGVYDNETSRAMDSWNKSWENQFPNYYTDKETNAKWWSPDNLLTVNFFMDKVVKNLGFSAGAYLSGNIWGMALRAAGITGALVNAGKGMEAVEALEQGMQEGVSAARLPKTVSLLEQAGNGMKSAASRILTKSEEIIPATFGTFSESGMEALNNSQEFRNQRVQEFEKTYGYTPTGKDMDAINEQAANVGRSSFLLNTVLLSATNYIEFPRITKGLFGDGRKAMVDAAESGINDVVKDEAGKWIQKPLNILQKAGNAGRLLFSPNEAFEEGAQNAIQVGTEDYYNKAYHKDNRSSFLDSLKEGVGSTLSTKEGWENILIGGFSGGLQEAGIIGRKDGSFGVGKTGLLGERGVLGNTGEQAHNTQQYLDVLNNPKNKIDSYLNDIVNGKIRGISIQEDAANAIQANDKLNAKDSEYDFLHNYLFPRIKWGRLAQVEDDLNELGNKAVTEFDALKTAGYASAADTRESFTKRLGTIRSYAENIATLHRQINDKYAPLQNKEGERVYPEEVVEKMVYAASKVKDYDTRIPQLQQELLQHGIDPQAVLENPELYQDAVFRKAVTKDTLEKINKLPVISEVKDDLKTTLSDLLTLSGRRHHFIGEYSAIKENPQDYKEKEFVESKTAIIRQPSGLGGTRDQDVELGKEYTVKGEPLFRDGNQLLFHPKMTVLSKTLGGEYEVKLPGGSTRFLRPNQFAKYQLTDTPVDHSRFETAISNSITEVLFTDKYKDFHSLLSGTPTLQEKLGLINSLNNKPLIDAIQKKVRENLKEELEKIAKQEAEREALKKKKEQWDALTLQQTTATEAPTPTTDPAAENEALNKTFTKTISSLFTASTSTSREFDPAFESKPHLVRAEKFKNNWGLGKIKGPEEIHILPVTQNNEAHYGLTGLIDSVKGNTADVLDADKGVILYVVARKLQDGSFQFVNQDGNTIKSNTTNDVGKSKKGTNYIFSQYPELAAVGSAEQYAKYLDSLFPGSKIKDIVYHGTPGGRFEKFDKSRRGTNKDTNPSFFGEEIRRRNNIGFWFSTDSEVENGKVRTAANRYRGDKGNLIPAIVNVVNPAAIETINRKVEDFGINPEHDAIISNEVETDEDFPELENKYPVLAVFEPEQIHVLGSKEDLEGFKKWKRDNIGQNSYSPLQDLIFDFAPSTDLVNTKGGKRYRDEEGKDPAVYQKAWKAFCQAILDNKGVATPIPLNGVSRGFAQKNKDAGGKLTEQNPVNMVIPKEVTDNKQVVFISTQPTLTTEEGITVNVPMGRPFLKIGSTIEFLNNRTLTKEEAENTFNTILDLAKDYKESIGKDGKGKLNQTILNKLNATLFWFAPGNKGVADNQWYTKDGILHKGKDVIKGTDGQDIYFDPQQLAANKETILTLLEKEFHHISNRELNKNSTYIGVDGKSYPTYQTYLLDNNILTTSIRKEMSDKDANFQGRYFLLNIDLNVPQPEIIQQPVSKTVTPVQEEEPNDLHDLADLVSGKTTIPVVTPVAAPVTAIGSDLASQFAAMDNNKDLQFNKWKKNELRGDFALSPAEIKKFKDTKILPKFYVEYLQSKPSLSQQEQQILQVASQSPVVTTPVVNDRAKVLEGQYGSLSEIRAYDQSIIQEKDAKEKAILQQKRMSRMEEIDAANRKPVSTAVTTKEMDAEFDDLHDLTELYSRVTPEEADRFIGITPEKWKTTEQWFTDNLPNVPFQRVKTLLRTTDGGYAWGKFSQAGVTLYEWAKQGTGYHEAFHAVFNLFLTNEERNALVKEWETKHSQPFNEETLADQFSRYVQNQEAGEKTGILGKIAKFFRDLWNTLKSIFGGKQQDSIRDLFSKINTGYFSHFPIDSNGVLEEKYSELPFDYNTLHQIQQEITTQLMGEFFSENARFSLVELSDQQPIPVDTFYEGIKTRLKTVIGNEYKALKAKGNEEGAKNLYAIWKNIEANWEGLKKLNTNYLTYFGISRTANPSKEEQEQLNRRATDEESSDETENSEGDVTEDREVEANTRNMVEYDRDIFTIDGKQNASAAMKIFFHTLRDAYTTGDNKVEWKKSLIGGKLFVDFSRAFNATQNALSHSTSLQDMLDKLHKHAKNNPSLYDITKKLKISWDKGEVNYSGMDYNDWRLLLDFHKTMAKQKPESYFLQHDGSTSNLLPGNRFDMINFIKSNFVRNLKKDTIFFKYDGAAKQYKPNSGILTKYDFKKPGPGEYIRFLTDIGINRDGAGRPIMTAAHFQSLNKKDKDSFYKETSTIYNRLKVQKGVYDVTQKALAFDTPLKNVASLIVKSTKDDGDSTFFNIMGEKVQSAVLNNPYATHFSLFNSVNTLEELLQKIPYLRNGFSRFSQKLEKGGLFFGTDGVRKEDIPVGYIDGSITPKGAKQSSKLSLFNRKLQSFNLNLNGWYIPITNGDKKTEWMVQLQNDISFPEVADGNAGWNKTYTIFRDYLRGEIVTAQEDDKRLLRALDKKGSRGKLRFFSSILSNELLTQAENLVKTKASEEGINAFIRDRQQDIHDSIKQHILKEADRTRKAFEQFGKVREVSYNKQGEANGWMIEGLSKEFIYKEIDTNNAENRLSQKQVQDVFLYRTVNSIINNIEIHKLFLGDPAFMEDPVKRIPGAAGGVSQAINGSKEFEQYHRDFLNRTNVHNADSVALQPGDIGYRILKDNLSIITYKDIEVKGRGDYSKYNDVNEADAQSKMALPAYRELAVRNGEWTDQQEQHYQWEMAVMRSRGEQFYGYKYSSEALKKHDQELLKTYKYNKAVFEIKKPKGFAQDATADEISRDYWKTSVQPLIPSTLFEKDGSPTNDEKLHYKLLLEGKDGAAVQSAVKLGLKEIIPFYDKDGNFNNTPYTDNHTIFPSWRDTGIQVETQFSQGKNTVTRGSQITRMVTMNLMSGGIPTDYLGDNWESLSEEEKRKASTLYNEVKTNDSLLQDLTEWGYQELLGKLGVSEGENGYEVKDWQVVVDYIKANNRDLDDNTLAALNINEDNDGFKTPLEAIPSYTALKGVLYSLVDKQIASPKMNGGGYVQLSSWGSESGARPDMVGNSTYKFYTKEEPWMEIGLPNWFRDQLASFYTKAGKEIPSDEELLKTLNDSDLLNGVGFRIPTQDTNSMEVFKVKEFLPPVMGNTVRVPSEITKKAGSDFDVDKENIYLKNVFINSKGEIAKVPTGNSVQEVQAAIAKEIEKGSFLTPGQLKEVDRIISEELDTIYDDSDAGKLFSKILGNQVDFIEDEITKEFVTSLKGSEDFKNKVIQVLTKKGLENSYYESLQRLLQLPQNYEKLTAINDASEYKELRNKLNEAKYTPEEIRDKNITVNNDKKPLSYTFLLSPDTLDEIRHNNVVGKVVTGIAALAQTSNALVQRTPVVLDMKRASLVDNETMFKNLGDGVIRFPHNTHNGLPTLSATHDVKGGLISRKLSQYVDGAVDVVKDTWLIELGVTPRTAGTFLLMERLGADKAQVINFMNQPIIQDYLNELDKLGVNGLYSSVAKDKIDQKWDLRPYYYEDQQIPKADALLDYIEVYNHKMNRTVDPRNPGDVKFMAEQAKMFNEFLKYQEMASDLFKLVQGVNWDTAHMSDGEIFHLKNKKYENANNTLFTPASEILQHTFVGKVRERLLHSRNAIGSFIALENPRIVKILNQIKDTFIAGDFLPNDKKYAALAKRVNNAFINYVLQVKGKANQEIKDLLLDAQKGVAAQLDAVKQQLGKGIILSKKNLFTVNPVQSADKKAITKASLATQYIGFGEGIANSSTELYRKQAGKFANTGNYSPNDVVFVSIGGKRGDENVRKAQQDKTIREALKAIEAGATLLTDNKGYVESSDYNEGEKRLAKNLESKGYYYSEHTEEGNKIGVWTKNPPLSTQQASPFLSILDQFETFQEGTGDKALQGVRFKRGGNDVFTKNGYTAQLRQLKDGPPQLSDLYKNLVRASLIQNGVQLSPNSYSHLIPNEDYSQALSNLIQSLPDQDDLQLFVDTDAFWRNNWKGDAIPKVPMTAKMIKLNDRGAWAAPFDIKDARLNKFEKGTLMKSGKLSEFLTYSPGQSPSSFMYDPETGSHITKKDAFTLGNPITNKVFLYKLVRDSNGNPILMKQPNESTGKVYENYLYKAVYAWGSGNAMQEYYSDVRESSISNNTYKPSRELSDQEIETALNNGVTTSLSANNSVNLNMNTTQGTLPFTEDKSTNKSKVTAFQEEQSVGYRNRTIKNASADATIAIALDFTTAGERLTKNSVISQNKLYLPVTTDVFSSGSEISLVAGQLARQLNMLPGKKLTLNIAGNGIYTLKGTMTQKYADDAAFELLSEVLKKLSPDKEITLIRSGGQTGFDEAGIKAAQKLGIPSLVLAPKGWVFRDINGKDIYNEQQFKARFNQDTTAKPINIYAGTGENVHLSNFAIRPFVLGGDEYASVEQYFQYQKWNYLKEDVTKAVFDHDSQVADKIMQTKNGAQLKALGRQFKGLDIKEWDKNASKEMKIALKASFEQNPMALQQLLSTGNAVLTHTQDKGKWGTEFPKLLMEVRSELGGTSTTSQNAQEILQKLEQNNQVKRNCN